MAAAPGNNYNPKGRGRTPNKITAQIKQTFANILEGREDELARSLDKLRDSNPKAFLELFIKISERFVPAVTRTEHQFDEGFSPVKIVIPEKDKDDE